MGKKPKLEAQPHGGSLSRSGRPKGSRNKPRPVRERVEAAAGRKSLAALKVLDAVMRDPLQPGAVRIAAARAVLDRGIGRVREHERGPDGDPRAATERLFGLASSAVAERERREAMETELERLRERLGEREQ